MSTDEAARFLLFGVVIHTIVWYLLRTKTPNMSPFAFATSFLAGCFGGLLTEKRVPVIISYGLVWAISYMVSFLITAHIVPAISERIHRLR